MYSEFQSVVLTMRFLVFSFFQEDKKCEMLFYKIMNPLIKQ